MEKVNHPLKARMYIGGLRSLFGDMHDMLAQVEKTGQMPADMVESFIDVKDAIDLTLSQLKKVSMRCCEHGDDPHAECDESCHDDEDDNELYCEDCDLRTSDCECDDEEDDEEEEEEPPPPPPVKKVKKADSKVVIPTKKKGK